MIKAFVLYKEKGKGFFGEKAAVHDVIAKIKTQRCIQRRIAGSTLYNSHRCIHNSSMFFENVFSTLSVAIAVIVE